MENGWAPAKKDGTLNQAWVPPSRGSNTPLLGHLGTVAGHFAEEVFGFLPRILVAVHAGTDNLRSLLVETEDAVHLVGGRIGIVALGLHHGQGHKTFQV